MVMFHHEIPYQTAFERGRIQQALLDELCAGIERIEQVDWDRATQLVRARLQRL